MAGIIVRRGGRIRASYSFAINFSLDRDVLANRETKDIVWVGKTESVAGCDVSAVLKLYKQWNSVHCGVMRDCSLLNKCELFPYGGVENRLFWRGNERKR
jgi:hypothetical protein